LATASKLRHVFVSPAGERASAIVATDGELLMRFSQHRDHDAFAEIVERHGRLVWMICRQVLRHQQDVEDAFQATFLILARRARTIRASDSVAAWLYKVAMRTALSARRKRARRREEPLAIELSVPDRPRMIDDREMLYVLLQEVYALPERYQTPLVMRYLEGQSRRAIAEHTDSTVSQIQGRLARGRRLLRSRFLRRGVSLSLAAGALAGTTESAKAAVTPVLVANTAKTCLAIKTSAAVVGLSPAVLELVKEGIKAMWVTFATKCAAVAAATLVAAGLVWAVEQGGGDAVVGGNVASVKVSLLSANEKGAAGSGNDTQANRGQSAAFLAGRLKYKVPVEIGDTEFKEGGRIEIEEVWGTRPRIEVGGQYMVRGKYVLPHGQRGKLFFYESATGIWGQPMPDVDLQTVTLDKESGEFTLLHEMRGPGYFHLYMASPEKYSRYFANVYFGTGDNVLRKKEPTASPADAGGEKSVDTLGVAMEQTKSNDPGGAKTAPAEDRRASNVARQRADYAQELKRRVEDLRDIMSSQIEAKSEAAAKLELLQIEKAALQRELEQLSGKLTELDLADINASEKEATSEAGVRRNKLHDSLERRIADAKKQLAQQIADAARVTQKVERAQLEVNRTQRRIDEFDRISIQFELPQEPRTVQPTPITVPASPREVTYVPTRVEEQQVQIIQQLQRQQEALQKENAERKNQLKPKQTPKSKKDGGASAPVLRPGDQVEVLFDTDGPDAPFGGNFKIDQEGKLVFGPGLDTELATPGTLASIPIAGLIEAQATKRVQEWLSAQRSVMAMKYRVTRVRRMPPK
jgi:RNA polymerase sigma factor (sigma-70 family)